MSKTTAPKSRKTESRTIAHMSHDDEEVRRELVQRPPRGSFPLQGRTAKVKNFARLLREQKPEEALLDGGSQTTTPEEGLTLWTEMPQRLFQGLTDKHRGVRMEFVCTNEETKTGDLRMYDVSTQEHGVGESAMTRLLDRSCPESQNISSCGATTMNVGTNRYEPDSSFFPRNRATSAGPYYDGVSKEFPTIVVEVAHCETDAHVTAKALQWISAATTVQECWVIRHSTPASRGGWTAGRMWFRRYVRGSAQLPGPDQYIEFGTAVPAAAPTTDLDPSTGAPRVVCSAANRRQIVVPRSSLWADVPVAHVPALAADWTVDLFDLQELLKP